MRSTSGFILLLSLAAGTTWARQDQPAAPSPLVAHDQPDPYEDRPIREVRLLKVDPAKPGATSPLTGPNLQLVRNQVRALEGRPYRRDTVKQNISILGGLGRFKTISSSVQMAPDGSVIVIYTFGEQPIIQDVQVVGNRAITDQEALAIAGELAGTAVDRFEIDRHLRAIENLYREKGYYSVRIEVDEKELAASSILVYRVIEGERVRVMGVEFQGNMAFSARELRSAIRTTEYVPIFEKGPLDDEVLKDDVSALTKYYNDRGYLDTRVSVSPMPAPNGKEALVAFKIDEGPLYTLRSVQVRYETAEALAEYRKKFEPATQVDSLTPEQMLALGRRCYTNEQIAGLMVLKAGDVFGLDKLGKSKDAIKAAYGTLGNVVNNKFLGPGPVTVKETIVRDEHKPEMDLLLLIDEGKPAIVGDVIIRNNEKTKQQVILHAIQVKPDRPLDTAAIAESRKRLDDTRLFERRSVKASIQAERDDELGARDILFEVTETNTGSFNFGVAVDSDAGLVGQISVTQRNFDLFDPPQSPGELAKLNGFRGGGQTAALQLMPGTVSQTYSVSLTEPHFFDTDYAASGRVFYNARQYRVYDEQRYGGRLGIGRKFGTIWEGSVGVRQEWIDISDIETTSPVDLYDVAGLNVSTAIEFRVARDTTDDRIRPSRGSHLSAGLEQFGALGGDFSFTKLSASYQVFLKLHESFLGYKTVLKLDASTGLIPQGQDSAPLFDRFYLGGQSFRGFANRGVSPVGVRNDTGTLGDDAVGGSFVFSLGAEISQPLYQDVLSGVVFVDTGTVQESPGLDEYRMSAGIGARVYIPDISPVPLAFDFGYPFIRQDTDRRRIFTFSIDVPF